MIPLRELRLCRNPKCNNYFKPRSGQIYCGSIKLKIGCSYKNRLELNKRYKESRRKYLKKYWFNNKERLKPIRNAQRRTPEYHWKVKVYKYNKAKVSQNNWLIKNKWQKVDQDQTVGANQHMRN